ncbi:hypothetical protein HZA33_00625 [Candidatus Pacearchaeota archaeon]|nr:hypothetical protein [Candidatus Pacearchaeota archaeon]
MCCKECWKDPLNIIAQIIAIVLLIYGIATKSWTLIVAAIVISVIGCLQAKIKKPMPAKPTGIKAVRSVGATKVKAPRTRKRRR